MTRSRAATVVVLTGIVGSSLDCRRGAAPREGVNSGGVTVTACPAGVPPAANGELPLANLTLDITTTPPASADREATMRLESETTRNTVRIDVAKPSQFALRRGIYVVRVSLAGYRGAEARVTLTAGCEATMAVVLTRTGK